MAAASLFPGAWPALGTVAAVFLGAWLLSLRLRDAGVADPFWGVGFVVAAWTHAAALPGEGAGRALALALVTAWGLRLALHLVRRGRGEPEDYRYRAMREKHGPRFGAVSLVTVFGLQAVLLWVVSLAVAGAVATVAPLGVGVAAAGAVAAAGLVFEAVADAQLEEHRRLRARDDAVLDTGLWAWSRHPNYFGDCVFWWGLWGVGVAAGGPAWTVVSPLLMTVLLLRVSGVTLLEERLRDAKPGYREYASRTSAFVPLPPRRRPRSHGRP